MNEQFNPYAPPTSSFPSNHGVPPVKPIPATRGIRAANFFIDYLVLIGLNFSVGVATALVLGDAGIEFIEKTPSFVLGIPIFLVYIFGMEATTGRTLGKLITGTRVVQADDGQPPTIGQYFIRSLCRLIPFEPFSFFNNPPVGWHDSISRTLVVSNSQFPKR